jgi:hypothetical protein
MADSIPPEAPNQNDDDGGTPNNADKARENKPANKLRQAQLNARKKTIFKAPKPLRRLTVTQWTEFGATVVCFLWIWPDFLDSHDVNHLFSYATALLVLTVICCYFLCKLIKTFKLPFAVGGILAVFIAIVLVVNAHPASFSIVRRVVEMGPTNGGTVLALYQIPGTGNPPLPVTVVSPIPVVMYVQLTNLKDHPVTIDSYSLEAEISHNQWQTIRVMNPMDARFFSGFSSNLKDADELNFSDSAFDTNIRQKIIGSHESVRGWMFASVPRNQFRGAWRMRILDSVGQEYVEPMQAPPPFKSGENDIERAITIFTPNHVDLTGYPLVVFK